MISLRMVTRQRERNLSPIKVKASVENARYKIPHQLLVELCLPLPEHLPLHVHPPVGLEQVDGVADEEDLLGEGGGDVAGDEVQTEAERASGEREASYFA